MNWPRQDATRLALVVLLALVVRLVFVAWWTHAHEPQGFEFPDSAGYWELGQRLAAGEPYRVGSPDRRVYRAPGYPLLLAAMFRVVGEGAPPAGGRGVGAGLGGPSGGGA